MTKWDYWKKQHVKVGCKTLLILKPYMLKVGKDGVTIGAPLLIDLQRLWRDNTWKI